MKILLLVLLPFIASAQMPEIKIGKCAGDNPILLWGGGGPDFGEFTLIVGEGPCNGAYFKIDHGLSSTIYTVITWHKINGLTELSQSTIFERCQGNVLTVGNFRGLKPGDVINVRYLVERKKQPRA